jgi:hypothetical protein
MITPVLGSGEGVLELDCHRLKILDPELICDTNTNNDFNYVYLSNSKCNNCPTETHRCFEKQDIDGNALALPFCVEVVNSARCSSCNEDEVCFYVNPLAVYDKTTEMDEWIQQGNDPDQWKCVDRETLNFLGIDFGSSEIAIPKLIRLILTFFFGLMGVAAGFILFSSLWTTSVSREEQQIEKAQKAATSAIIGVVIALVGVILVQIIASLFGITGDLFDLGQYIAP